MRPTKIYTNEILKLTKKNLINTAAHITGGGLFENIIRSVPKNLSIDINLSKIKPKKIFKWLKSKNISDSEMLKTFNCGVGFCLIINPNNFNRVKTFFTKEYKPYIIGKVIPGNKIKINGKIDWK